jgi:sn-glycerol 3-phosphate transport system substrate-binding protein
MVAGSLVTTGVFAAAPVRNEIVLRHQLNDEGQVVLTTLVARFNEEQRRRGQGRILLQQVVGLDEVDLRMLPTMALLQPDDSPLFFNGHPRFRPLHQVMTTSGSKLDVKQFFPLIADAVSDHVGRIQALPLGLSLPVLMWDRAIFLKVGLDPDEAPKSWFDVQTRAGMLNDAGISCPLTSSRFAWIHLENISTQQGEALAREEKGGQRRMLFNNMVGIKHLALLSSWYKSHYFRYFGPGLEADQQFLSGECGMITAGSSLYQAAVHAGRDVGMAPMPFYDDMYGATRDRVFPEGAALWVLAGKSKSEYQTVAAFARFMLRPDVQAEWLSGTGFLPMTPVGLTAMKSAGTSLLPLSRLASQHLYARPPAKFRPRHNLGLERLRSIINEEVVSVWANLKPAKEALDTAMRRVNSEPAFYSGDQEGRP